MYDSNLLQCGYKCPPEGAKGVSVDVDYIDLKKCDKLREKFHDLKKCDELRKFFPSSKTRMSLRHRSKNKVSESTSCNTNA